LEFYIVKVEHAGTSKFEFFFFFLFGTAWMDLGEKMPDKLKQIAGDRRSELSGVQIEYQPSFIDDQLSLLMISLSLTQLSHNVLLPSLEGYGPQEYVLRYLDGMRK
jgi:hypothetical protein